MIYFINRFFAPDESATSQMLTQLVEALSGEGFACTVIASRMKHDAPTLRLPREDRLHGARVLRIWSTRFGRERLIGRAFDYLSFYLSAWLSVWRLRPGDVLVALTDPPMIGNVMQWLAQQRGARVVHWLQDVFPEVAQALLPGRTRGRWMHWLLHWRNRSLMRADALVVLGSRMAEHVHSLGVAKANVHVVPNWANETQLSPLEPSANPLREQWGLAGFFVIGYSGNLGRAHEFETLVQAMVATADEPRIRYLFVGQGAQWASLKARVAELGLSGRVVFQGFQPTAALRNSLSVPDLHIVTLQSELEGLIVPSKLYGAMAVGRPVAFIGDHDGEVARCLRQYGFGVHVEPGQGQTLAAEFRRYSQDPERVHAEGQAAYSAFIQHFSRKLGASRWAALLGSMLAPDPDQQG